MLVAAHLVLILLAALVVAVQGSGLGAVAPAELETQLLEHFLLRRRNILLFRWKTFFHPLNSGAGGQKKRSQMLGKDKVR